MTTVQFPGNTLFKVVVKGTQALGSAYENVYHFYQWTDTGGGFDSDKFYTKMVTYLTELFNLGKDRFPTNAKWDYADYYYKRPTDPDWVKGDLLPLNLAGTDTNHELPAGVSAQITGHTTAKRRYGRKFFPAFSELESNDNVWLSQALVRLALMALKYVAGIDCMTDLTWLYPIVLRVVGGDFQWNIIRTGSWSTLPAYQRRRKPGVGI